MAFLHYIRSNKKLPMCYAKYQTIQNRLLMTENEANRF